MISIRHMSKSFSNPDGTRLSVLKDVCCEIDKGEVISIIGLQELSASPLAQENGHGFPGIQSL